MNERNTHPMLSLKVQIPFWICTLIWGTTWIVIRGQLGTVPPIWSVAYRFLIAGGVMFAYAAFSGQPLRLGRAGQRFAMLFGVAQFTFNFNFVYEAETHITSGLVAILFALLIVPNTLLGRLFLGQRVTARFTLGSVVAIAGIVLLFINEYRQTEASGDVLTGIALTLCGVLFASSANVLQGTERARSMPMASMLAWGMLWGTLINAAFAWGTVGPPVVDWQPAYLIGLLYLGVVASAIAFLAYFSVIRLIGPGPAAYSSIVIPIIAMGFSTVFEGYRWTAVAAGGGALALVGLAIALSARRPAPKSG